MALIYYDQCPVCRSANIREILTAKDYTVTGEQFAIWQCDECALRFTQNVPDESSIGKYYQSANYISHSDTHKGFVNGLYHRARQFTLKQKYKWIRQASNLSSGKILDAGCGTGAFLHFMQQQKWEACGVEPDAGARNKAMELYHIKTFAPEQLFNFSPASFDIITLWHVLEHVHHLHDYLQQLKKLLRPGGLLFIAVPNYTCCDAHLYKKYWAAYDVPRHLYHFSPAAVNNLLQQHGLKLLAKKPMLSDPFYICLLSEKYKSEKNNFIRAGLNGIYCAAQSLRKKNNCSSITYIITLS